MSAVYAKIRAFVRIVPGMRVQYLPPPYGGGEDYRSDLFFETHNYKKGTVTTFEEVLVGPFDFRGRLPGVYADPEMVNVVFDGEQEEHRLKYVHLAVIGNHESLGESEYLQEWYRLRDLSRPIAFYPGDYIFRCDDLLKTRYEVKYITYDAKGHEVITVTDQGSIAASDASLASPGLVRLLYENRMDEAVFASPRDAVKFWTEQGVSKVMYPTNRKARHMFWYDLEGAAAAVAEGRGHFYVEDMNYADFVEKPKHRRYHVYRLHRQFAQHAARAAKAASEYLALAPVPA